MKIKLCLICVALLFVASCVESEQSVKGVQKVKCEAAECLSQQRVNILYPAKVVAAQDVNISFRVAGFIDKVAVREGDFVREGSLLATLDDRDYQLQLEATEAEYNAIKGEVDRIVALYESRSVPKNDYDKAVNGLKQITAKLQSHRNALSDTQLLAPFDGYIQKINFDTPEAVSLGAPVISMISGEAEIVVNLPVSEYLRRGDLKEARAIIETLSEQEYDLQLIGITHKANLNQLYEARFAVEPKGGVVPAIGLSAMVSLYYSDPLDAPALVPSSALIERDGGSYLWVMESGVARLREVKVGKFRGDGRVVIESGVSEGEMVITAGVNSLKEGQRVEALPAASRSNVGNIL